MSTILAAEGIVKDFGAVRALDGVSLSLAEGEIRALCGENGAGKSTLVSTLMGICQPDAGTISVQGVRRDIRTPQVAQNLGLALVAQELSLAPHLSIFDNIWLGDVRVPFFHRRAALRSKAEAALRTLGVDDCALDCLVGTLSIGHRQLVEIARLIARNARILILDEPTATLSDVEITRIFGALRALKNQGKSIIYITHRLGEVFEICDSVTVLRNGAHVATRLTSNIDRHELIELMLGRKLKDMYPAARKIAGGIRPLVVEDLSVPGAAHGFSMVAQKGQILCLAGQIGSGAHRVVRSLAGLIAETTGDVQVNGWPLRLGSVPDAVKRGILFISEDRAGEGIFPNRSALENVTALQLPTFCRAGILSWRKLRQVGAAQAARIGIQQSKLDAAARDLSGGNQQKLLFGRGLGATNFSSGEDISATERNRDQYKSHNLSSSPGILLMNEPTRGVDVGSRGEIYEMMREFCGRGGTIVMASSDMEEVVGMADAVITMFRGRKVGEYHGSEISMGTILADITHPVGTREVA